MLAQFFIMDEKWGGGEDLSVLHHFYSCRARAFVCLPMCSIALLNRLKCISLIFIAFPAAAGTAPAITSGGVVNGASFIAGVAPGSWITIFGTNLSTSTATATSATLVNGYLPTSLGGASVTIDGQAAFIDYASPTQLNVESPADSNTGPVTVVVTTSAGTASATATLAAVQPGLFTFGNYVAAVKPINSTIVNGTGAPYLVVRLVLTPPAGAGTDRFQLNYDVITHEIVTHVVLVSIRSDPKNRISPDDPLAIGVIRGERKSVTVDRTKHS
jgi:hypothetical protein